MMEEFNDAGMVLFLIGPPGCGKSTVADFIEKDRGFNFARLQPGEMLRRESQIPTALGEFIKNNWNHDSLSDISVNMMQRRLRSIPTIQCVVVDGHPRSRQMAIELGDFTQERPVCVIDFVNCDNQSWERLHERQRENETNKESMDIRWRTFQHNRDEIVDVLRDQGVYYSIDGSLPLADIYEKVFDGIVHGLQSKTRIIPTRLLSPVTVDPIERACVIQYAIHQFKSPRQWKHFPGRQAVSMTHSNLAMLRGHPYAVSVKADGERRFLIPMRNHLYAFNRALQVFDVLKSEYVASIQFTVLDVEWIPDSKTYVILDMPFYMGTDMRDRSLLDRMAPCEDVCLQLQSDSVRFFPQKYHMVENVSRIDISKYQSIATDGFIFTPVLKGYDEGMDTDLLKWKPSDSNTVDFLYNNGTLFVKDRSRNVRYDDLIPTDGVEDGMIIECTFTKLGWKFLRVRTDKTQPNVRPIADNIMESIRNPVTWYHLTQTKIKCS
jgi:adenylate kinase family enzyme